MKTDHDLFENLKEALINRKVLKEKVLSEVSDCSARGELTTNGQMPSWPAYREACDLVSELEEEMVK